jgi:hypothetical protein
MTDYIFLMHDDAIADEAAWGPYLQGLRQGGRLQGGSAIGDGVCARKSGTPAAVTTQVVGFIRVNANDMDGAKSLLPGNPVFEAGGTVEIRELPRVD